MFTLKCTRKLLITLKAKPFSTGTPATTTLGDWYGNTIPTCRGSVVICTNERTLLTVVLPLMPDQHPLELFTMRVYNLLMLIGVSEAQAEAELRAMNEVQIGKSQDRKVLGTMNEIALTLQLVADAAPDGPLNVSTGELQIAKGIFSYIKYIPPSEIARALLNEGLRSEH